MRTTVFLVNGDWLGQCLGVSDFAEVFLLDRHIRWFEEFVSGFFTGAPEHDTHIALKKEHSLNVLAEARAIAGGLALSADVLTATHLGALYHDAGRFPQYSAYKTFQDSRSCNHALLGVRTMRPQPVWEQVPLPVKRMALAALSMHNRRAVPASLSRDLALVTGIVRDSDKLDIVRIMLEHFRPGGKRSDVVMLHLAPGPGLYTPAVARQVLEGRIGEYAAMRYENDFKLLLLSWVHDFNHRAARRAFLARGHAEEIFSLLPEDAVLSRVKDTIYKALQR